MPRNRYRAEETIHMLREAEARNIRLKNIRCVIFINRFILQAYFNILERYSIV